MNRRERPEGIVHEKSGRYVFPARGVCCPEIHFHLSDGRIRDVHFMGGGCPGNARLAARLMEGMPAQNVVDFAQGIPCRNETSCPDQLALGIAAALSGELAPARSFRIQNDPAPRGRIGLMGWPKGRGEGVRSALKSMEAHGVDGVYCLGNLFGGRWDDALLKILEKENIFVVAGEADQALLRQAAPDGHALPDAERVRLESLPHALTFSMNGRTGVVFYGRYLQALAGYSDFEPFALEINMVCDLTDFMENRDTWEALKAMIPQFDARIIIFGQTGRWGFWEIGDAAFVSVGAVKEDTGLSWGLLENRGSGVAFRVIREPWNTGA